MKPTTTTWTVAAVVLLLIAATSTLFAQGITTAAIGGRVVSSTGEALPGATVTALHVESGSKYGTSSRENGRFVIPNIRVGGPYTVSVSLVGYRKVSRENVFTTVSQTSEVSFVLTEEAIQAAEQVVTGERQMATKTGAGTNVDKLTFALLPTISSKFQDFVRLTPESRGNSSYGGNSYLGQDSRYNNTTVDGAYFNNSFGLQGQVGERTGVAPISLDAIEQVRVNIAPYDVRQGNFVGAAVNAVTKSGTNNFSGSLTFGTRNNTFTGKHAGIFDYKAGTFDYNKLTVSLGGPIIQDKLFFFVNYEGDKTTQPGTTFTANPGGAPATGNMTRVLASDLDGLRSFLTNRFGYDPGSYQGYDFATPGKRYLAKLDFNLDERNKFTLRYNRLESTTDVLMSNSSSLGAGTRRSNNNGLNFSGSNYTINENDYSIVGEWNTILSSDMYNNLIVGYSYSDESRGDVGQLFPFVDILKSSSDKTVYTSFGSEPFTPNNELRYWSYQIQNNFTWDLGTGHVLTFGFAGEKYHSENVFFPGKQSAYIYNSLQAFYDDANYFLNPASFPTAPAGPARFQVRYNNIPGQVKPVQPLDVYYWGLYAQDEYQVSKDLKLTLGIRFDVPSFGATGFDNANADALTFMDETGAAVKYNTAKLPDAKILWSPRVGFNYDLFSDGSTILRGGTGIFTGKPAYVWISNQIGNTGVLTGFDDITNPTNRHFNPNPDAYKPTNVTGAPASTYELALTDPEFRFPQQWRTNLAVDQKLPFDINATLELLYGREINGVYYINANQLAPNSQFAGPDNRPRWDTTGGKSVAKVTRINQNVANATVIKNENTGYNYMISLSLEKQLAQGFFGKVGYNYGVAKNTVDPGSIASGSWTGNQVPGNPNNVPVGYSQTSPGSRIFAALSYRLEYFNFGATTVTLFFDNYTFGNGSYTYNGDMNGDGVSNNDLVYVPRGQSEMLFVQNGAFTPAQQAAAWDKYIGQDKYLSTRRGQYAERNGAFLPMVSRMDLSIIQSVFTELFDRKHTFEIRLDVLNFSNLLSKTWGQGQHFVNLQPLIYSGSTASGVPQYKMRIVNNALMDHTFESNANLSDVYSFQLGLKYYF
jgi:outer membrane receptor protein involved in Fe transport